MGTKIEWTDETWNPTTGCTKVSPGCDHCYAETFTERFHGKGSFAEVKLHPDRLDKPLHWKKPRRIFVNSMSDLFHADVPDAFIVDVFAQMWWSPQHTFQVLTKRHARMLSLVPRIEAHLRERERDLALVDCPTPLTWPLPNVHLGVSVENQQWADVRIPALLDTPAAVRWISAEPLLGPVDLVGAGTKQKYWLTGEPAWGAPETDGRGNVLRPLEVRPRLDWVVVGGESGRQARPMHPSWARKLRDQCAGSDVPFLFKQHGEWIATVRPGNLDGTGRDPWADREPDAWVNATDGRVTDELTAEREVGDWMGVYRVGKKAAGRELDHQLWGQYPAAP